MKAKEKQLLEYLKKHCPGRENAISGKQMKKRFRIHEAELRKLVHNLRGAYLQRPHRLLLPRQRLGGDCHNRASPANAGRRGEGHPQLGEVHGGLPPAWGR